MSSVLEFNGVEIGFGDSDSAIDKGLDIVIDENNDGGLNVISVNSNEGAVLNFSEQAGSESANDAGDDIVVTGRGFDVVFSGDGDDIMVGGDGADLLHGGAGSDIIRGGTGEDIIIGAEGADIMMGGSGADIFRLQVTDFANGETDRIMDFEVGVDAVEINGVDTDKVSIDGNEVKYGDQTILRLSGDMSGMQGDATDEDTFELF